MQDGTEYVPDNPDGSGEAVYEFTDDEGQIRPIPYHYEHVAADSLWEVVELIPYAGETPAHLNTYQVPGDLLGGFLVDYDNPAIAAKVISVRRLPDEEE